MPAHAGSAGRHPAHATPVAVRRRVTPTGQPAPAQVPVVWEVSRTFTFGRVHSWGRALATAARDYTVKVCVQRQRLRGGLWRWRWRPAAQRYGAA